MEGSVTNSTPAHGGNLTRAAAQFGQPADGWLDLSTGINPVPYPNVSLSPDSLNQLPSEGALDQLLAAARRSYGIHTRAALCAAPGTQALIEILPTLRPAARVGIVSPTYGEHAHVWRRAGHTVLEIDSPGDVSDMDVVVVTNPNNPDGRLSDPASLGALSDRLAGAGGWLVVDEAFADVTPHISLAPQANRPGLIILRSFGKFFGLAGLRLGFATGPDALVEKLRTRLGPWSVSGPALEIGSRALNDRPWIAATRAALAEQRDQLDRLLQTTGFTVLGGTDLFRLTAHTEGPGIYERLGRSGILVRAFPDHPDWLRFGLPGGEANFERLAKALG